LARKVSYSSEPLHPHNTSVIFIHHMRKQDCVLSLSNDHTCKGFLLLF
jgi:hypothetical protein